MVGNQSWSNCVILIPLTGSSGGNLESFLCLPPIVGWGFFSTAAIGVSTSLAGWSGPREARAWLMATLASSCVRSRSSWVKDHEPTTDESNSFQYSMIQVPGDDLVDGMSAKGMAHDESLAFVSRCFEIGSKNDLGGRGGIFNAEKTFQRLNYLLRDGVDMLCYYFNLEHIFSPPRFGACLLQSSL